MSKKYEDLSKEELLKKLNEFEKELKNKKYGLVWEAEKFPEQVVLECENNLPVLEEVKEREIKNNNVETKNLLSNEKSNPVDINSVETRHCLVSTNNTQNNDYNILIEGDNYHALTVLNYTHENKIDVIYIDPPYNTGNKDFIYNDHYVDKEDSYRHSKWLNFMEKRLKLAKNLLKEDGVIFISIDDNEQAQLKLLCDKIFGEENFVAKLIWKKQNGGKQDAKFLANNYEYILSYIKSEERINFSRYTATENLYKYRDENNRLYNRKHTVDSQNFTYSKSLDYFIISPEGTVIYAGNVSEDEFLKRKNGGNNKKDWCWTLSENEFLKRKEEGRIDFLKNKDGLYRIYKRVYMDESIGVVYDSFFDGANTGEGARNLKSIIKNVDFAYPKPKELIKYILSFSSNKNSTILDFFAGSGTTGHAVLELNKEDSGNRKFILCTNNQNNICEEVTYKRLEKVMNGYNKNGDGEFINGLGGNLKYFKTSLVKKSKSRSQLKIDITQKCTEMLCLKESIFDEVIKKENYKIFTSTKKDKHLAIYYNFLGDDFGDFIEELKKLNTEIIVYVFSVDNRIDEKLFKGLDVKLEAIPQKILEVYKSLMKI